MKKILSVLAITFALLSNNVLYAQSDAFFSYSVNDNNREAQDIGQRITVPYSHELRENQDADPLPLGTGLLILTGAGALYAMRKKN